MASNLVVLVKQDEPNINSPEEVADIKKKKTTSCLGHYLVRDLVVWIAFIFILPLVLFGVYYFVKEPIMSRIIKKANKENSAGLNSTTLESLSGQGALRRPMRKISLDSYPDSICMDGSRASYYLRQSKAKSRTWIIFLQGGFLCFDSASCQQRSSALFELTSSLNNKLFKDGSGVLSFSPTENQYFYDINAV
jgi:hypothetical protein